MITGNEPLHPTEQYFDEKPFDIQGGLTLKQHMVIEFTKALLNAKWGNNDARLAIREAAKEYGTTSIPWEVKIANQYANEVIKQLNDEDK